METKNLEDTWKGERKFILLPGISIGVSQFCYDQVALLVNIILLIAVNKARPYSSNSMNLLFSAFMPTQSQ